MQRCLMYKVSCNAAIHSYGLFRMNSRNVAFLSLKTVNDWVPRPPEDLGPTASESPVQTGTLYMVDRNG